MVFSPKQFAIIEEATSRLKVDFTVFSQKVLDHLAANDILNNPDDHALIEAIARVKEGYR